MTPLVEFCLVLIIVRDGEELRFAFPYQAPDGVECRADARCMAEERAFRCLKPGDREVSRYFERKTPGGWWIPEYVSVCVMDTPYEEVLPYTLEGLAADTEEVTP